MYNVLFGFQCTVTSTVFEPWNSGGGNVNNIRNTAAKEVMNLADLGDWDLNETAIPRYA